jgi:hypothetical protein
MNRKDGFVLSVYVLASGAMAWLSSVFQVPLAALETDFAKHALLALFGPVLSLYSHASLYG